MVKVSIALTRRADLTHEQFVEYWTQRHTPLLASLPPGALSVRKYAQQLRTPGAIDGTNTAGYDAVAELWVDSVEDAAAWFTGDTYLTQIAPDEEHFLDRSKTTFFFSDETIVFG